MGRGIRLGKIGKSSEGCKGSGEINRLWAMVRPAPNSGELNYSNSKGLNCSIRQPVIYIHLFMKNSNNFYNVIDNPIKN